ncbi:MAG: hypothetical protein EPO09_05720 [Aquabacterium sp.]|uniref:hypothetical protein n=1 Tax=Aquabacterium sp. TaxID=1872578 RepID=UPI0012178AD0|nr:hypothetical protein [Aquabacterium sp.]TAK96609.1 MAG: hypothetical protein EPO09_05720 [Aquabacterium sp.]
MNAHVWTRMAMASALMVWSMSGQAQQTVSGGSSGQGAIVQQTRPAPVSGKVGSDPAAVALRPAAQAPVTSKATQVAPPANPNEPLFSPSAETPARVAATTATPPAPVKTTEPVTPQRKPHVEHTKGVKKPGKTEPQAHDKKVNGKPRHGSKGSEQPEGARKDAHKSKKKADDHKPVATASAASRREQRLAAHNAVAHPKGMTASAHQKTHLKPSTQKASVAPSQTKALAKHGSVKSPTGKAANKRAHAVGKGDHVVAKSMPASKASSPAGKKAGKATRPHKAA